MITVYEVIKKSGVKYSYKDVSTIGKMVSERHFEKTGRRAKTIQHLEGKKMVKVRCYSSVFTKTIQKCILEYYAGL
jgi:DUF917 family protein